MGGLRSRQKQLMSLCCLYSRLGRSPKSAQETDSGHVVPGVRGRQGSTPRCPRAPGAPGGLGGRLGPTWPLVVGRRRERRRESTLNCTYQTLVFFITMFRTLLQKRQTS